MSEPRQWHRLFGITWTDLLSDQPVTVEMEKDVSVQKQLLDVLILRRRPEVPLTVALPDGFDDLGNHNLISFKSFWDTTDGEVLNELAHHYVAYRKLVSPDTNRLLPENEFRLYVVSARYPVNLEQAGIALPELQPGVYSVRHFTGVIRLIVVARLPLVANNALLHLYSADSNQVQFGRQNFAIRSSRTSTILLQLMDQYGLEGMPMPFTVEEFDEQALTCLVADPDRLRRLVSDPERLRRILQEVPANQRLEGVPVEQRLEGVPVEQRLEGISIADLLQSLTPEQQAALRAQLDEQTKPS